MEEKEERWGENGWDEVRNTTDVVSRFELLRKKRFMLWEKVMRERGRNMCFCECLSVRRIEINPSFFNYPEKTSRQKWD